MKPITRSDLQRRYGYFLQYLAEIGALESSSSSPTPVTPDGVDGFIARVRDGWTPVTLAQSVYKLRRMAEILSPGGDFLWLQELEKDLALVAYPRDRFDRIVISDILVEAGLTLVKEAEQSWRRRTIWRASQVRDGLMLALLALTPIRLKNLAGIELGKTLIRDRDQWWIILDREDTKEGRPDERALDEALHWPMASYLTWSRPILLRQREWSIGQVRPDIGTQLSGPLWIGQTGDALGYSGVERQIREMTRLTIGVGLSPHDFRSNGATTCAFRAGSEPHLASALLHHSDRRVTEEHYNRASNMSAALAFRNMIREVRRE